MAQTKTFCGAHDIWVRQLAGGDIAVVLWNRGVCGSHSLIGFNWTTVGLPAVQPKMVRYLFLQYDLGVRNESFTGFVNASGGVLMLRLSKHSSVSE